MDASEYDNIARLEAQHWWYRGMAAISMSFLGRQFEHAKSLRILDAGCGPGGMLRSLSEFGQTIGIDFHPLAISYAQTQNHATSPLVQGSITHLPLAGNEFDLVTSFDVLYHRAVIHDGQALAEFARILKPGGHLLIRVPALEALRGHHDVVVHTRQRYDRTELKTKLESAGFLIKRLTYANSLLFPLIFLRRHAQASDSEATSDVELPSPLVNNLLGWVMAIERFWLSRFDFPIGVSLFALAAKP
jgi:SAM-dependent methyltransferase